ncbi:MAG: DNA primase [Dehalococcoidia bacterium]
MSRVDVEQVKRRNAIADVVQRHGVRLRREGRRLVGLCPFHEDRSPSFSVYPETQSFHCFGCGASGDVIDFVRRAEGLGFREAVARLDGATNVAAPIPKPASEGTQPETRRRLSLDDRLILTAACELYHETLLRTPGILQYLETRGVPAWAARLCRVGYSDGRLLVPYLRRRRLSLKRARELGLLFRSDDETMTDRVVIPDLRGAHCGWMVGRVLDGKRQPKYRGLSLPRPLLGYERARGHARVFLTEGPFDWLTLVGWGLPACALLGTQPGRDTLRLLGRARSVVLVLDGDEAGREAAAHLATALGDRARVLELPESVKDVNELGALPDGRETFFRLLDETEGRVRDAAPAS